MSSTISMFRRQSVALAAARRSSVVAISWLLVNIAAAQSSAPKELGEMYARLAKFNQPLSREAAEKAAEALTRIKLDEPKLESSDRAKLLGIRILTALAMGDAATALAMVPELQKAAPASRDTSEIAYLAAAAAGDAQLGVASASALEKASGKSEKDAAGARRAKQRVAWMSRVGDDAPQVTISSEETGEIDCSKPGDRALLIDFWDMQRATSKPDVGHAKGLVALHKEFSERTSVAFLGVNSDGNVNVEKAREYAKVNYPWPQSFVGGEEAERIQKPEILKAFDVGVGPWAVVVDDYGYIRAVGAGDDPALTYALRAAAAEAAGDFKHVPARTKEGRQPGKPAEAANKPEKKDPTGGHFPSNPEAKGKLDQAILFWKTGKRTDAKRIFQEIIDQYPNSQEAETARQYL